MHPAPPGGAPPAADRTARLGSTALPLSSGVCFCTVWVVLGGTADVYRGMVSGWPVYVVMRFPYGICRVPASVRTGVSTNWHEHNTPSSG